MKKNVGGLDRTVRMLLGIVLGLTGLAYGSLLGVILGVILILTAIFGMCPLYSLLGISTAKKDSGGKERYAR